MWSVNFENSRIHVSYRGGVLSLAKLRSSGFGGHCGGHNRIDVVHEGVFSQKLRASSCMSFLVSRAKVLSNKRPVALREVAMVDLFWIVWGWHALDIDCNFHTRKVPKGMGNGQFQKHTRSDGGIARLNGHECFGLEALFLLERRIMSSQDECNLRLSWCLYKCSARE